MEWRFFSFTTSETATTADRRCETERLELAARGIERRCRVDPRKEGVLSKAGLSLDLGEAVLRGRGCANLVAENDIVILGFRLKEVFGNPEKKIVLKGEKSWE